MHPLQTNIGSAEGLVRAQSRHVGADYKERPKPDIIGAGLLTPDRRINLRK